MIVVTRPLSSLAMLVVAFASRAWVALIDPGQSWGPDDPDAMTDEEWQEWDILQW